MITLNNASARTSCSGWIRAGSLCLLTGVLVACEGGGGNDHASLGGGATETAATTTVPSPQAKSVERNDPIVYSENPAALKSAENKCRKNTRITHGEGAVRKSVRERLRAERCTERANDSEHETEKIG